MGNKGGVPFTLQSLVKLGFQKDNFLAFYHRISPLKTCASDLRSPQDIFKGVSDASAFCSRLTEMSHMCICIYIWVCFIWIYAYIYIYGFTCWGTHSEIASKQIADIL